MRSVTLPQVLMLAVVLAAVILAQRFAPGVSANVVSVVGIAVAWFMKSPSADASGPPPASAFLPFVFASAMLAGLACGPYLGPDQRKELVNHQSTLERCKAEARAAADAGKPPGVAYAGFEACLSDAGVP